MLHIATVHFESDRWIGIQSKYLKLHMKTPYQVYACVPEPKEKYRNFFYFTSDYEPALSTDPAQANMSHPKKLNYLANVILENADDTDYLIFIDGDAFPVTDIFPFLKQTLDQFPLAAVRRNENGGDKQPHPCFCATTSGFWKQIRGDWSPGFTWKNNKGEDTTDVGGNLLGSLENNRIPWYPMLRSNKINLHPLWFGLYENLVYHHGAGFRPAISRIDLQNYGEKKGDFCESPEYRKNKILMERIFLNIQNNENFYLEFMENSSRSKRILSGVHKKIHQLIKSAKK